MSKTQCWRAVVGNYFAYGRLSSTNWISKGSPSNPDGRARITSARNATHVRVIITSRKLGRSKWENDTWRKSGHHRKPLAMSLHVWFMHNFRAYMYVYTHIMYILYTVRLYTPDRVVVKLLWRGVFESLKVYQVSIWITMLLGVHLEFSH